MEALIVALLGILIFALTFVWMAEINPFSLIHLPSKKDKSLDGLSSPAKELVKKYNALPETNKPYANMVDMLKALDVKHSMNEVNIHFSEDRYSYDGPDSEFTWRCICKQYGRRCQFIEYHNIREAIQDIQESLKKQAHALEVSKVAHDLNSIEAFTMSLREESTIIDTVTRELVM